MYKRVFAIFALLVLAVPFAVLAQDDAPEATAVEPLELEAVDPLAYDGDIIIDGSSTVGPLTRAVAERFNDEGFVGNVDITITGSSTGITRFCEAGDIDIANASRAIKESEIETCTENGRAPLEFQVGVDALSIVVSRDNDFVEALTLKQLGDIFTGAVTTWDEVDASFPAEPIQLFTPGDESGTFGFMVEVVIENADGAGITEGAEEVVLGVPGIQTSSDDNVLAEGVASSPYAIGYFGFAYYVGAQDRLRAVAVDAGEGAVVPNEETAESGEYFLSRPLFLYSSESILDEKPQVGAFISYYLTNVNDILAAAVDDPEADYTYFPASVTALNEGKQAFLDATTN